MTEIVVCEKRGEWAAVLRRHYDQIAESRSLDDCRQFLNENPHAVAVLDVAPLGVERVAGWISDVRLRDQHALFLGIVPRDACTAQRWRAACSWLREAGAADLISSFGDVPRVNRIVQRHFDRFRAEPLSLEQRIWNNLPWAPRLATRAIARVHRQDSEV